MKVWKYADAISVLHAMRKIGGRAVDQNQLNLGMRHTERLDHMFDRRVVRIALSERTLPTGSCDEPIELGVKAKFCDCHGHLSSFGNTIPDAKRIAGHAHQLDSCLI